VPATSVTVDLSALADVVVDVAHDSTSVTAIAEAWEAALRVRAPAQHAGTPLVRKLAAQVSRQLGLDATDRQAVDVCAQIRDIGMITLPDSVVLKTGPLSPGDWVLLNRHPELGANLLRSFPIMAEAAMLVRAHHERWDGDGYPDGLRGDTIPLPSRVVAVCDAFVSIATDRPHRRGIGAEGAMEYILGERGAQFDPRTVDWLWAVITGRDVPRPPASLGRAPLRRDAPPVSRDAPPVSRDAPPVSREAPVVSQADRVAAQPSLRAHPAAARPRELRGAIAEFEVVPAFEPAVERALAAAGFAGPLGGADLPGAIESDIGLTIAILRAAQRRSNAPVLGVPDAVALLTPDQIRDAITALPTVAFPWQTKFEALLLRCASHAQAVARATDRIAQKVQPFGRDELVAGALLHDVGRLLLAVMWPDFADPPAIRPTPEEAVRQELREAGFDHAALGGLLAERWGLPSALVSAVSGHHSAHAPTEPATLIRLADMVVHHAHGDTVDRELMLRLASRCELSVDALRTVVIDLPHSGGSARRRAERSPLSRRETATLKFLAEGRRVASIALELQLSESTVRTHLHNVYAKLEVPDRTQAVLRATEMGWI
jgi:HD-GYP domain-containing protein (c-di-GMP phosphodiesterase class II)/DNA-binding CsgD family transcriptional regulator